jgi:hypothetical protein
MNICKSKAINLNKRGNWLCESELKKGENWGRGMFN